MQYELLLCIAMTESFRCVLCARQTDGGYLVVIRNYTCHVAGLGRYVEIGTYQ